MANLKFRYLIVSLVSFSMLFALSLIWISSNGGNSLRTSLKYSLSSKLIHINHLSPGTKVDVIYVLGGSQRSLEAKYKIAADLFHKGISNRIWILSRPGKTEYCLPLGRNLTNNEWSLLKFKEFGVPKEYIEQKKIKEGFFGTFSEANGISSLVEKKGYTSILLITAPFHTRRVKISFDNYLKNQNTLLFIYGSEEKVFLRGLILEFFKLKIYQYFLI